MSGDDHNTDHLNLDATCPTCDTVHPSGLPADTLGGGLDCIGARARALGDDDMVARVDLTRDWTRMVQANALGLPLDSAEVSR